MYKVRVTMRSSYLALSMLPIAMAASCSIYDTSLLLDGTGGSNGTGNTSGSGSGGGPGNGGTPSCQLATYPPRPTNASSSTRDITFVSVMKSIDLGDSEPNAGASSRRR